MIKHMFSPAAVACLVDGRLPRPEEVEEMAAKIWQDAYRFIWHIEWNEVERGSKIYLSIYAAALMALGAMASLGPDLLGSAI